MNPNNQAYDPVQQDQVQISINDPGFDQLMKIPSVYIQQGPEFWENIRFCSVNNVYYVYQSDAQGSKPDFKNATPIFKCKEDQKCQRYCLPGDCRAFEMKVRLYDQRPDSHIVLRLKRDYKCTCFCMGRPMMEVFTDQGQKIGQIIYPFMCCENGVIVQDNKGENVYKVFGSCWQWPFLCNCPCQKCQRAVFHISDIAGQKISEIWKESTRCCKDKNSDRTNFRLIFPTTATPVQKALLIATTLFLDMNYFEVSPFLKHK